MNRPPSLLLVASVVTLGWVSGCISDPIEAGRSNTSAAPDLMYADSVAWAVNVGGEAMLGMDGVAYQADDGLWGGTVGQIDTILGSQDSDLYTTYRAGDLDIQTPLANGSYDITFHFAEPEDQPVGSRVFTVLAEGQPVIDSLDVRGARDGKHRSALTRTVPGIEVTDGQLELAFEASVGEPILNALVVRKKVEDTRDWTLAWADEFDGDGAPDSLRWSYNIWPARKVNDEDQAYTDRLENVRVEDGHLILEAHKEDYDDASYTSGRIHSEGKGDVFYGRIEVRAKLPAGQGTWPAIWMLPSDPYRYATNCSAPDEWQGSPDCDAWPNSGEIDIMEHVGFDMNNVHGTVHNRAYFWVNWEQRKGSIEAGDVSEAFHVYALEWTPDRLDIFLDGTRYFTYVNDGTGWRSWPYDHPFNLILNVAVGGFWGRAGGPIDDSIFPTRMEVDYVRVYTQAESLAGIPPIRD